MKRRLFVSLTFILLSYTLQQSDIKSKTPHNLSQNKTSSDVIIDVLSNYTGDAVSVVLDFLPYIGNFKCLCESLLGVDLITGKNLTDIERILSLICAIPFANFFKGGKNFKNGKSFLKASERAFSSGKIKNFIKFGKASGRAFAKPNIMQKIVKAGTFLAKGTKSLSKSIRVYNNKTSA